MLLCVAVARVHPLHLLLVKAQVHHSMAQLVNEDVLTRVPAAHQGDAAGAVVRLATHTTLRTAACSTELLRHPSHHMQQAC